MELVIRSAKEEEMDWVNGEYKKIHFPLSNFESELIVIAEVAGEKAGMGRLITIDEQHGEIGGMYVLQKYRNQGIAKEILQFLLSKCGTFEKVFLFSYERSHRYYRKFGFKLTPMADFPKIPERILTKLKWCNDEYDEKVVLQELE